MDVRKNKLLRLRREQFGGMCYVPQRDDFFALDRAAYAVVASISADWSPASKDQDRVYSALAKLGICETRAPQTREIAYSGPSFIGSFKDIVTVPEPLVLNCFATAFCPLRCVYCHAEDLMADYRASETDEDLNNVAATASLIPAMVAVITGGDPLTRPERARKLIESLHATKSLVLDTSGVGEIDALLDVLVRFNVHVRISVDAASEINDKLRPTNKDMPTAQLSSFQCASETIDKCLAAGVPVTVQTVVSRRNEDQTELLNLRDWLVQKGVKHWVLHVTVEGGSARQIEAEARRQSRPRGIVPSPEVYQLLQAIIDNTTDCGIQLDIRCTDTGNTPNSVLLLGSNGNLYTEGLAHPGKVELFAAADARPDRIRESWHHVDAFGHARRYLNWNPEFYSGISLSDICYNLPIQAASPLRDTVPGVVEIESKYRVADLQELIRLLNVNAECVVPTTLHRDEYYDTHERVLRSQDFVVRVRQVGNSSLIGLKGARFRTPTGEYSRVEVEFPPRSIEELSEAIRRQGLVSTWYLEKKRATYHWKTPKAEVVVDEIPKLGVFIEIEGSLDTIRQIETVLRPALGDKVSDNYNELVLAYMQGLGMSPVDVPGISFDVP